MLGVIIFLSARRRNRNWESKEVMDLPGVCREKPWNPGLLFSSQTARQFKTENSVFF